MAEWYKEASDAIREDMIALSDSVFSHPELGYEEFASSMKLSMSQFQILWNSPSSSTSLIETTSPSSPITMLQGPAPS